MATLTLDTSQIFLNDVDLTGMTSEAALDTPVSELDVSTYGDAGWRKRIAGPKDTTFILGGPWGFADPDNETWDHVTAAQATPALTIATTSVEGDVAYFMEPVSLARQAGGQYGEAGKWNMSGGAKKRSTNAVFRGGLSLAKQTITGVVNGTGIQLTPADATNDTLAAVVHVFADNGTSLDLILERDDNSGFTTATTVETIAVTGVGQQWAAEVAYSTIGADTWFRFRTANLIGTNFQIAAVVGIAYA